MEVLNKIFVMLSNNDDRDGFLNMLLQSEVNIKDLAILLDKNDPLAPYRSKFHVPKVESFQHEQHNTETKSRDYIYLSGNSLGLCPKLAAEFVANEVEKWQKYGAIAYTSVDEPWMKVGEDLLEKLAALVGAEQNEVALMNTLTVNLHFLMISFYQPTSKRYKIIMEGDAFPSDVVLVRSQIRLHGFDPDEAIITIKPREGEHTLRTDDIIELINSEGEHVALILMSGVQYYTGQYFDLKTITHAGHCNGCYVGFDLAHAVGNVNLKLHEWNIDFACWCSYKYLNGGPGSVGGAFVHSRHASKDLMRLEGWWGIEFEKRFKYDNNDIEMIPGALGYVNSMPPVLSTAPLKASLEIFNIVGMEMIQQKQRLITGFLETLLYYRIDNTLFEIITPRHADERGSQLSILFKGDFINKVYQDLKEKGVVCDMRGKTLRVAPCPLYNSFSDVYMFVEYLHEALNESKKK